MTGRIDLDALREASGGDPSRKVAVGKAWLTVVLGELEELERRRAADRARPSTTRMPAADRLSFVAPSPGPIRRMLEAAGLVRLPRDRDDDPVIMETWL